MLNNIKSVRLKHGLTQRILSERIGATNTQLSQYELGRIRMRIDMAIRIAIALDTTLDKLFMEDIDHENIL